MTKYVNLNKNIYLIRVLNIINIFCLTESLVKRIDMESNKTLIKIIESWGLTHNPINSTEEILEWIRKRNTDVKVRISKIPFEDSGYWYYDENENGIINKDKAFFQIKGLIKKSDVIEEAQPIIIQNEIGYLGIIAKEIDGVIYFLMQAKIEPGNVNKIQISPTIQATKSNFMQSHGGKVPAYLEYFSFKKDYHIIVDQIQSEHSSFFLGKRNRNIIILIDDDIEVLESHKWMTLGQIKQLMSYDNLVNMDTRTVLACIPFALRNYTCEELRDLKSLFTEESFFNSIFLGDSGSSINKIYQYINEIKMHDKSTIDIVDLYSLPGWKMVNNEFVNPNGEFKVIYCDIEIAGREVNQWKQPLFETIGESLFGLIFCIENGVMKFLIQTVSEVGCFDKVEIGPSVQLRPNDKRNKNAVTILFNKKIQSGEGVLFSGLFSEEGGRFYHAQNRNVVIKIEKDEIPILPQGFFWADFHTLNILVQFNNCLNIQLRNLLSILKL